MFLASESLCLCVVLYIDSFCSIFVHAQLLLLLLLFYVVVSVVVVLLFYIFL